MEIPVLALLATRLFVSLASPLALNAAMDRGRCDGADPRGRMRWALWWCQNLSFIHLCAITATDENSAWIWPGVCRKFKCSNFGAEPDGLSLLLSLAFRHKSWIRSGLYNFIFRLSESETGCHFDNAKPHCAVQWSMRMINVRWEKMLIGSYFKL